MELRSAADELWFSTAHLECHGNKGTSTGTGFFYALHVERVATRESAPAWFMVTNRHVAELATDRIDISLIQGEEFQGSLNRKPRLGEQVGIRLKDPLSAFHFHPDDGIDIAILPFSRYMTELAERDGPPMIRSVAAEQMLTAEGAASMDSLEQVVLIGYPDGLYDSHNLTPIARTGCTATPIRLDYQGRPTFLVDAPVFPGSSGSPVFRLDVAAGGADRVTLLGIVAEAHTLRGSIRRGKKPSAAHLMDLGIVYKASAIDEAVDEMLKRLGFVRTRGR